MGRYTHGAFDGAKAAGPVAIDASRVAPADFSGIQANTLKRLTVW
jgi:hypothetical protein